MTKLTQFAIWTVVILTSLLALFAVLSWIALLSGSDGFQAVMTQFFGKAEQILDVAVLSGVVIMGIILLIILFRRSP